MLSAWAEAYSPGVRSCAIHFGVFTVGSRYKQRLQVMQTCPCLRLLRARLCGLVVRVLGYRSGGPGSIPGTTRKKVVGLERGPLSLVSTTEELLDRKVAAPV
jgi:hypothetical protein